MKTMKRPIITTRADIIASYLASVEVVEPRLDEEWWGLDVPEERKHPIPPEEWRREVLTGISVLQGLMTETKTKFYADELRHAKSIVYGSYLPEGRLKRVHFVGFLMLFSRIESWFLCSSRYQPDPDIRALHRSAYKQAARLVILVGEHPFGDRQ